MIGESDARIRLAFRVGITGARPNRLAPDVIPRLQKHLQTVLRRVRDTVVSAAADSGTRGAYAEGTPLLRLLSPLAEGSDRMAAEAALELGYQLEAALPFPVTQYKDDFPATVTRFRPFLGKPGKREHLY